MSILAIIAALLIEQWRPLGERRSVSATLSAWAASLERSFNGGERRHGMVAWLVAVLPPVIVTAVLYWLLAAASGVLALLFNIAVLYLTLGFRQFSHYFTDIQLALKAGDVERARSLLEQWRGASGVVLWYLLLPGPSGAILYRLAAYLAARWKPMGVFGNFATRAFHLLEWPAVRITAAAFALVGDFENTIYCWRTQARTWADPDAGILLAAGAGAMGVRLGMPVQEVDGMQARPELGAGEEADG